jgi:ferric-dicitrate binding protein FerR (iron transport regulator)
MSTPHGPTDLSGSDPLYQHLRHAFDREEHVFASPDARAALGRFYARWERPAPRRQANWRLAAVGMGSALLIAIGVFFSINRSTANLEMADNRSASQVFRTNSGEQATVRLTDGSTVILGPSTTVQVLPAAVLLDGEALFAVHQQRRRAFNVKTANAFVSVLGTTFTVRHYPSDAKSRVVVKDGRVTVRSLQATKAAAGGAPFVLSARMLSFVSDSGISVESGVTTSDYMGWVDGQLVFNRMPLRDVATEVARTYGVEIRIPDSSLANVIVSMTASVKARSVAQTLDLLVSAVAAHHTRIGQTFIIARGEAGKSQPHPRYYPRPEVFYGR